LAGVSRDRFTAFTERLRQRELERFGGVIEAGLQGLQRGASRDALESAAGVLAEFVVVQQAGQCLDRVCLAQFRKEPNEISPGLVVGLSGEASEQGVFDCGCCFSEFAGGASLTHDAADGALCGAAVFGLGMGELGSQGLNTWGTKLVDCREGSGALRLLFAGEGGDDFGKCVHGVVAGR